MQELEVKRGHWKNVDLDGIFSENFGTFDKEDGTEGTWYVSHGPAMKTFKMCMIDKSKVLLDIQEDRSASTEEASQAIRTKNLVLQAVTGFTAKQRAKRAQEAAKKSA